VLTYLQEFTFARMEAVGTQIVYEVMRRAEPPPDKEFRNFSGAGSGRLG